MNMMNSYPTPGDDVELDLHIGKVVKRSTGEVIDCLEDWTKQNRILANESFIATRMPQGGWHFLDMAVAWPNWFDDVTFLQEIRTRVNAPRSRTSAKLKPFGWTLLMVDRWRAAIRPDPNYKGKLIPIRASRSFSELEQAVKGRECGDYTSVLANALFVLDVCRESRQARLLAGECFFRHGLRAPATIMLDTARHLLEYQVALQLAINTLSRAWGREADRNPLRWSFVEEKIYEYEGLLRIYSDVFERARVFLMEC